MQEWDKTSNCGKGSCADTELATAMTTGACFWRSVLSICSSLPMPCSSRRIGSRQHGDTHAPNTGTSWTTPKFGSVIWETYHMPEWCPVQTATLIIGWYAAKLALPSSLLPTGKVPRQRNCMCTDFVTQGWKTISKSGWQKDFIVWLTGAEPEEQWKQMKTIVQETTA